MLEESFSGVVKSLELAIELECLAVACSVRSLLARWPLDGCRQILMTTTTKEDALLAIADRANPSADWALHFGLSFISL